MSCKNVNFYPYKVLLTVFSKFACGTAKVRSQYFRGSLVVLRRLTRGIAKVCSQYCQDLLAVWLRFAYCMVCYCLFFRLFFSPYMYVHVHTCQQFVVVNVISNSMYNNLHVLHAFMYM